MNGLTHLPTHWRQCVETFLDRNPSLSSRERNRSTLSCFFQHIGTTPADQVTANDIETFVSSLSRHRNHGQESTKNHQRRRLHIVTAFYRFASTYQVNGQLLYQKSVMVDDMSTAPVRRSLDGPLFPSSVWNGVTESFLSSIQDISGSERSRASYAQVLRGFFADPERTPDTYNSTEVKTFLNARSRSRRNAGAEVSPGTKNARLVAVASFYKFAAIYEINGVPLLTGKSPCFGLKYCKTGAQYRALSVAELERVLNTIPSDTEKGARDRALILFYWFTGRRRSEVQRLTWSCIEHTTLVDPDGSRRPGIVFQFVSKGRSRETSRAELPQIAWFALERYLQISGRLEYMQADSPLFTSSRQYKGMKPLNHDYVNKVFKEACAKAGLDASTISLHALRHSAARTRFLAGQDIISLKQFLGHSSLQTTYQYCQQLAGVSDSFALKLEQQFAFLTR